MCGKLTGLPKQFKGILSRAMGEPILLSIYSVFIVTLTIVPFKFMV